MSVVVAFMLVALIPTSRRIPPWVTMVLMALVILLWVSTVALEPTRPLAKLVAEGIGVVLLSIAALVGSERAPG